MTTRRLRLALDAGSALPQLLGLGLDLAERLDASLESLFIEDVDLLRSAAIEPIRQVCLLTATEEPFDVPSTERELHALAQDARRRLEESARSRSVEWSASRSVES